MSPLRNALETSALMVNMVAHGEELSNDEKEYM